MGPSARAIAEQATFHAFLYCYLREVDPGQWIALDNWSTDPSGGYQGPEVCMLRLDLQRARLAVDIPYRSQAGRHRFGKVRVWHAGRHSWSDIEPIQAVYMLIRELYGLTGGMVPELRKSRELELLCRLTESYQVTANYIAARRGDARLGSDLFIDTEQSLLFGHSGHPTPKSRQGFPQWQHSAYAPELAGSFRLEYFSVHRSLVEQGSGATLSAEDMVTAALSQCRGPVNPVPERVLIPAHPLQAQWLMTQSSVRSAIAEGLIQPLGALGPAFTATSSVRTVYSDQCDWMFKFSIPVKITNSLRTNKYRELRAGMVMAGLTEKTGFNDSYPQFCIINDPAWLTVKLPGKEESGFEVIIRDNPFYQGRASGIFSIAAITQDPVCGQPSRLRAVIEGLALNEGRSLAAVSRDWFRQYLACAIEPALRLYDDHGIALEAHQQNSLLDLSGGYPRRYFYRDNQGYYLSESKRGYLTDLEPGVSSTPELFYRDAMIRDRFCYYLVVNQLFSMIARFGQDELVAEQTLLDQLRHRLGLLLPSMNGPAVPLIQMVLRDRRLPYKGNLLTRVHDVDELNADLEMAVYTSISNPLTESPARPEKVRHHAVA